MALKPYKDISGQTFGELTAISISHRKNHQTFWNCKCSCGKECKVSLNCLVRGHTKSCGHLKHKYNDMSKTKLYKVWKSMNERCYLPSAISYKNYGSRGIRVCDEWRNDFVSYYNYVKQLPHFEEHGYSLDRIDNNGNYEPGNVRYSTKKDQQNNRRNTIFIEINDETKSVSDWAKISGLHQNTIRYRYDHGVQGYDLLKRGLKHGII